MVTYSKGAGINRIHAVIEGAAKALTTFTSMPASAVDDLADIALECYTCDADEPTDAQKAQRYSMVLTFKWDADKFVRLVHERYSLPLDALQDVVKCAH
jgi:hypothetical protein